MSKKHPPQPSPWRLFVSRTALLVGVLALGVLLYTQKQENVPAQADPEAKTYAAMKMPVEDTAFHTDPEMPDTAPRQPDWQATSEGYVNAADPGSYDTGFDDITVTPVGQDAAETDYSHESPADNAGYNDSNAGYGDNYGSDAGYSTGRSSDYSTSYPAAPEPPVTQPASTPPVAAKTPQTVPIPQLSPSPIFSGNNTGTASQPAATPPPHGTVDAQPPATGYRVANFLDVFNFDVTPDWVTSRWKHVASVGPVHTRGYRVPLVTGTDKSDLVGNLTYYFNAHLEVEKITFEGFTGDLDRLVITLRHFSMAKRLTSDPNMLIYETPSPSKQRSYLKTYHRTALEDENHPYRKFWVTLELYPPEDE